MSRSRRKTPIFGNAAGAESEKADKRRNHARERARLRAEIARGQVDDTPVIDRRQVSNVAAMAKDGRHYWRSASAKDMRK